MSVQHVPLTWNGHPVEIEIAWIHPELATAPVMVFLHEGLGSVAMWKDFPQRLCQALGWRGLVYSRPGYGRSTPRPASETWGPDFMHRQAGELLPALLQALGLNGPEAPPLWLFGHSDGGSISLLHAAGARPCLSGAIVLAPHILVEDISVRSIEGARQAYESGPLRPGPLPRRPGLGLLGLEPHLAGPGLPPLEHHGRACTHPLPGAGRARPGRRIRHAGADPGHCAPGPAHAVAGAAQLRPFTPSRPARGADRCRAGLCGATAAQANVRASKDRWCMNSRRISTPAAKAWPSGSPSVAAGRPSDTAQSRLNRRSSASRLRVLPPPACSTI